MKPEELAEIRNGARVANMLPYVEDEIERMQKTLKTKTFELVRKGELTPERAVHAWMELYSYDRLLRTFRTKVKMGESAGEKTATELKIGD